MARRGPAVREWSAVGVLAAMVEFRSALRILQFPAESERLDKLRTASLPRHCASGRLSKFFFPRHPFARRSFMEW